MEPLTLVHLLFTNPVKQYEMKRKQLLISYFKSIPQDALASIKGGNEEEDRIIYIDGKPYKIEKNSDGSTIYVPL